MNYEPIFKGEWPHSAADRWTLIRRFLSFWCFGRSNPNLERCELSASFSPMLPQWTTNSISPSLNHWSDVVKNYAGEHLVIRDVFEISDLSSHLEVPTREFTVMLIQGESDVFWAVKNDTLSDDDPPVFAFQDYDPDSRQLLGTYSSVSSFALWYFCLYNDISKNRVDVFSYDFSNEAEKEICDWFPHRLLVQKTNPFCSSLEILEATDCVGIRVGNRLTCSLFVDHNQLGLPSILSEALKEAHRHRQELKKLFKR